MFPSVRQVVRNLWRCLEFISSAAACIRARALDSDACISCCKHLAISADPVENPYASHRGVKYATLASVVVR